MGSDDLFKKMRENRKLKTLSRLENNRNVHRRILIVCEGEKTEPLYFKSFRVPTLEIIVKGEGKQADKVVEEAINYIQNIGPDEQFDKVWCVFDKDDVAWHKINRAFELAKSNNIKIAYSNVCFELWYLLHFEFLISSLSRVHYSEKLSQHLTNLFASKRNVRYRKNDENLYKILHCYQNIAIRNAEKLIIDVHGDFSPRNNPVTTVHLLVKDLINNNSD